MAIHIIKNDKFWTGSGWSNLQCDAREYTRDRMDVAVGVASLHEAKAILNYGKESQRVVGDVPRAEPIPLPPDLKQAEIQREEYVATLENLDMSSWLSLTGQKRFRRTKAEMAAGLSPEDAFKRRKERGEIQIT